LTWWKRPFLFAADGLDGSPFPETTTFIAIVEPTFYRPFPTGKVKSAAMALQMDSEQPQRPGSASILHHIITSRLRSERAMMKMAKEDGDNGGTGY